MEIVGRGVTAAGLGVYAAIHLTQAFSGIEGSPFWLAPMFVLTSLAAIGFAVAIFASSRWRAVLVSAAILVVLSLIALIASYTTGFFGVNDGDLTSTTLIVVVAEAMTVLGVVTGLFGDRFDFDEDAAAREAATA